MGLLSQLEYPQVQRRKRKGTLHVGCEGGTYVPPVVISMTRNAKATSIEICGPRGNVNAASLAALLTVLARLLSDAIFRVCEHSIRATAIHLSLVMRCNDELVALREELRC